MELVMPGTAPVAPVAPASNVAAPSTPVAPVAAPVVAEKPPETPAEPDLKAWAKASKENRELKATNAKLVADLEAAKSVPAAAPQRDAIIAALKAPGVGKLLTEAGRTFNEIVDEMTGDAVDDVVDPRLKALADKLQAIEDQRAKDDEAKKVTSTQQEAAAFESAIGFVTGFISKRADEVVDDAKDPRHGTPRYALVAGDRDAMVEAHAAVSNFCKANKLVPTDAQAEDLLTQAVTQLELAAREALSPMVKRLSPKAAVAPAAVAAAKAPLVSARERRPVTRYVDET
jgi:hypothetical protein